MEPAVALQISHLSEKIQNDAHFRSEFENILADNNRDENTKANHMQKLLTSQGLMNPDHIEVHNGMNPSTTISYRAVDDNVNPIGVNLSFTFQLTKMKKK